MTGGRVYNIKLQYCRYMYKHSTLHQNDTTNRTAKVKLCRQAEHSIITEDTLCASLLLLWLLVKQIPFIKRFLNYQQQNIPPRAISLLSRLSEISTGTLGFVVTVAVSPLAGM